MMHDTQAKRYRCFIERDTNRKRYQEKEIPRERDTKRKRYQDRSLTGAT